MIRRSLRRCRLAAGAIQTKANPERDALLLCHALEKGMGVPDPRKGFGREKAQRLVGTLKQLETSGKSSSFAFREGLAVLKAYCDFQQQAGTPAPEIAKEADALAEIYGLSCRGGCETVRGEALKKGSEFDFAAFAGSRHSMRAYSDEVVTKEEILEAVRMAKQCPSACNRQPWKFRYSLEPGICRAIMKAVPPQPFLEAIPYFGVVTVDKTLFGENETNQWYVNGGIFLGYLSLAFHSLGIGSCCFQYEMFSKTELGLRNTLGIPEDEVIIAVLGYGKYPEEAKCILAERRPESEIAIEK